MNGLEERVLESGVEHLKDGLGKICTDLVAESRDSDSPPDYRNFHIPDVLAVLWRSKKSHKDWSTTNSGDFCWAADSIWWCPEGSHELQCKRGSDEYAGKDRWEAALE